MGKPRGYLLLSAFDEGCKAPFNLEDQYGVSRGTICNDGRTDRCSRQSNGSSGMSVVAYRCLDDLYEPFHDIYAEPRLENAVRVLFEWSVWCLMNSNEITTYLVVRVVRISVGKSWVLVQARAVILHRPAGIVDDTSAIRCRFVGLQRKVIDNCG